MMNIKGILQKQKQLFNSNLTKDIDYRKKKLKHLKEVLEQNEEKMCKAIFDDFRKSKFDTYMTEFSIVYHDINLSIKKLSNWAKPKRVKTNLSNFPSSSFIYSEPLGNILVIGAWNYPYQLSLAPAIAALSAGNTVILKPSEIAPNCSKVMAEIINENFDEDYFFVVEGGIKETTEILEQKFDKIFFTGSTSVGKIIYEAAAKNLTPVVLELGGKSPTFILKDASLETTAKRIAWSKFVNAGQTCIAPDYILIDKSIKGKFIDILKDTLDKYYKDFRAENYTQIINDKNFQRLIHLIDESKVVYGNNLDKQNRYISPTILDNISFEDAIMQEEIFGPLLPIIEFESLEQAISKVKEGEKPLSCYIYTNNKKLSEKMIDEISFGGGCVNDSLMHLTNPNLPFGGVGSSGFGNYHGKFGFDTFSHLKSVLKKTARYEPDFKFLPYTNSKMKGIKWMTS